MKKATRPIARFSMPSFGETYTSVIFDRCENLIDRQIWQGLPMQRLHAWRANFRTPIECYFAARVLDGLIYRSRDQTRALAVQLFQRSIPDLLRRDEACPFVPVEMLEALRDDDFDPGIRVVPVIRDSDPPTKSGPLVARLLKKTLQLAEDWMCWPWQIEEAAKAGVRIVILVDDFVGTGDQLVKFAKRYELGNDPDGPFIVYAPLTAYEDGLKYISDNAPSLRVAVGEVLGVEHNIFHAGSSVFDDGTNNGQMAEAFYREFLKNRGVKLKGKHQHLGYGALSLAFAFEHATPNATLPLLWANRLKINPLLER